MTLRVTTSNETAPDVSVAMAGCQALVRWAQGTGDKDRQRYVTPAVFAAGAVTDISL